MKTILVADDEPGIRQLLKERFESIGIRCLTASDGEEAVRLAYSERPNLIILDLVMPVCDGLEAYRTLKNDPDTKDLRVLVYTAQDLETIMSRGIDALEIVDFILKPMSLESLSFLVSKTLASV